jgi:RNA polymerase sigma factor (sigma-70 family)
MSKDYELVLKIKNAPMLNLMRSRGYETAAQLSRASGINQRPLGEILNLQISAFTKFGAVQATVAKLCDFFGCLPEHLFPEKNLYDPLAENKFTAQIYATQLNQIKQASTQDPSVFLELLEEDENAPDIDEIINRLPESVFETENKKWISDVVEKKYPDPCKRLRKVMVKRYKEGKTLRQVGIEMGLSVERIRQLEARALRWLRHPNNNDMLREVQSFNYECE